MTDQTCFFYDGCAIADYGHERRCGCRKLGVADFRPKFVRRWWHSIIGPRSDDEFPSREQFVTDALRRVFNRWGRA